MATQTDDWRQHPWAIGREAMLEGMTDERRAEWIARRDEEDAIYREWRTELSGKPYRFPWED